MEKIKLLKERLAAAGGSGTHAGVGSSSAGRGGGRGAPAGGNNTAVLDDMSFGDKHAALCFAKALDDAKVGRRLLESVQALIVLVWWMNANARWSEGWAITGMIMRGWLRFPCHLLSFYL